MNFVMGAAIGVSVTGVVVMLIAYRSRHAGGRALMFFGAALIVESISPLMKGRITDTVQILLPVATIILALAGTITAFVEVRRRRALHG